jgi:hypothetical protein
MIARFPQRTEPKRSHILISSGSAAADGGGDDDDGGRHGTRHYQVPVKGEDMLVGRNFPRGVLVGSVSLSLLDLTQSSIARSAFAHATPLDVRERGRGSE